MFLHSHASSRRTLVMALAGAVTAAGLVSSPAHAATTTFLYPGDVNQSDTRAAGSNTFLASGGVQVTTVASANGNQQSKAAGYFSVNELLATIGEPQLDLTYLSGARPSIQLVTDFDGNGTPDGILVGESVYGTDWWVPGSAATFVKAGSPSKTPGSASFNTGGSGSEWHGRLSEWRTQFPAAKVLLGGWSLGSGVVGDGIINAITIGDTRYVPTNANRAPVAPAVTASGAFGATVTATLAATDPDGDPITYTVGSSSDGTATVSGDQVTFVPGSGFAGTTTFTYTASDGRGGSTIGQVTITVAKADSTISASSSLVYQTELNLFNAKPLLVLLRPDVTISGKITTAAAANPNGGTVTLREDGTVLATTTVSGRSYTLPKLLGVSRSTHTYTVEFGGTSNTAPSSVTKSVTVG